ncbi:MAG: hypothetical protein M3O70_12335 [Actinomycetota bacterium]|nr:hypothetical protein [Actinomycetota bacterium]
MPEVAYQTSTKSVNSKVVASTIAALFVPALAAWAADQLGMADVQALESVFYGVAAAVAALAAGYFKRPAGPQDGVVRVIDSDGDGYHDSPL